MGASAAVTELVHSGLSAGSRSPRPSLCLSQATRCHDPQMGTSAALTKVVPRPSSLWAASKSLRPRQRQSRITRPQHSGIGAPTPLTQLQIQAQLLACK